MKLDINNHPTFIPSIVLAGMLLLAIPNLFPYSYYWGVRWIVTTGSIYFIYKSYKSKNAVLFSIFILLGILFNPVYPIHLNKTLWMIIDFIAGLLFLISNVFIDKNLIERG